jgi:hypothetical protein
MVPLKRQKRSNLPLTALPRELDSGLPAIRREDPADESGVTRVHATPGRGAANMANTSWVFVTFDTAGEVSVGYAAGASAISRANGVRRVLARAVCRTHAPSRSTFSPTAVRIGPRRTLAKPI